MAQDSAVGQSPSVCELRRERERAEMIQRIMDVAREMFVRDGYEAVTLRKIAHAIEYSQGIVYQYFKDKQALVEAIIQRDVEDLRGHLTACLTRKDPVERLVEMARLYVTWGAAHPNHYHLMLLPPPEWAKQKQAIRKSARNQGEQPLVQEILSVLYTAVKGAIERGRFKDKYSDPALVAATLWAGVHGVVLLQIGMSEEDRAMMGGKDTNYQARFDTLKEVFLDGFLKNRNSPKSSGGKRG